MMYGCPRKRTKNHEEVATQSQQAYGFNPHMAKPKGESEDVNKLHQEITKDKGSLKTLLQQRMHQIKIDGVRRRKELLTLIAETLSKPTKPIKHEPSSFAKTKVVGNSIFSSAIKVNTACCNMLSQYYKLEAKIKELGPDSNASITDKWMQDIEETERLLRVGHKAAGRNTKKVVGMESYGFEATEKERQEGIGVLKKLNMELREGLRYTERGVKRMVKGITKTHP